MAATNMLAPETGVIDTHWLEWLDSGVDPEIIADNCETAVDTEENPHTHEARYPISEFLNWSVTRFGHKARESQQGWICRGLDPFKNWGRMDWGCLKLDTPRIADKKPLKYEHPKGVSTRAFFLSKPSDPQFWQRVQADITHPIVVVEGAKKAGALVSLGYAAIGLPGIFNGYRKGTGNLIPELELFAQEGRSVHICFDYETKPKVLRNLFLAIGKLERLFAQSKCQVSVIELPGPEKGVDDFIVAQGAEAFHSLYQAAVPAWQWHARRYARLTYPISERVNQRYLDFPAIPHDAKLVAVKSPKGTGKTELYTRAVQEAHDRGQRVLLISHRVQLAQAICDRVGLPYLTEVRSSGEGELLGFGLCIDSLHPESQARFNAEYWKDAIVIIDECEQVFWHLLSADTQVTQKRMQILEQLKELLIQACDFRGIGRIYLSDADLTNLSIDFIRNLSGLRVEPWLLVNEWKPTEPLQIHHYNDQRPHRWLAALDRDIAEGGKPFVITHSQKAKSLWGTRNLENFLKSQHPDKKFLRIDSETISNPEHPAFGCVSKLNEILPQYDGVIASPSIETGVSIDIKHFTGVWGVFQGVVAENSARQSLARVRDSVPRHLWVTPRSRGGIGNGATSHYVLYKSQEQLAWANLSVVDALASFTLDELNCSNAALESWAKFGARINAAVWNYRNTVLWGLAQEGHEIIDAQPEVVPGYIAALQTTLKAIRDDRYSADWLEAVPAAPDLTEAQYEKLKAQKSKTEQELLSEHKHKLKLRYLVPVTPELVQRNDDGWYPKIQLYYYLQLGREFLKDRDKRNLEGELKDNRAWFVTLNRSQLNPQVKLLEELGVPALFVEGKLFNKQSQTVKSVAEKAKYFRDPIKTILNLTVSEKMTPIQIAQLLLSKLGVKLAYVGHLQTYTGDDRFDLPDGYEGSRERCYAWVKVDDGRDEVYTQWLARDLEAQIQAQQELHTPSINNQNRGAA